MAIKPSSFLLGLAVAWALPAISRVFRPLAVEAAVAGMAVADDVRRVIAEQMETLEDIAAEARARREEMLTSDLEDTDEAVEPEVEPATTTRTRRRSNGTARRRAS